MSECKHLSVVRWYFDDTGECCDLWACTECRQRFEPLTAKDEMTQRTHWDGCWKSGPAHYECALGEIERLQLAYDDQHAVASLMHQQAEKAEAEVERLKEDYRNACKTVVQVHAAATGRPGEGPFLGVIEDAAAVCAERDALQAEVERLRAEVKHWKEARASAIAAGDSMHAENKRLRAERVTLYQEQERLRDLLARARLDTFRENVHAARGES